MILASRLEWVPSAFTGINPSCITARADSSNITNIRTAPNKTFLTSFSSARSGLAATAARRTSMKCRESFSNDDRSCHVLMTFAAEYVTRESELACLVGSEVNPGGPSWVDVRANPKRAQVESVLAILGREHQHNWLVLLQGDRVRREVEFLRCYVNLF